MDLEPANDLSVFLLRRPPLDLAGRPAAGTDIWTLVSAPSCSLNSPFRAPYRPYLWFCFRSVSPVNDSRSPREILNAALAALWPVKMRAIAENVRPMRFFRTDFDNETDEL